MRRLRLRRDPSQFTLNLRAARLHLRIPPGFQQRGVEGLLHTGQFIELLTDRLLTARRKEQRVGLLLERGHGLGEIGHAHGGAIDMFGGHRPVQRLQLIQPEAEKVTEKLGRHVAQQARQVARIAGAAIGQRDREAAAARPRIAGDGRGAALAVANLQPAAVASPRQRGNGREVAVGLEAVQHGVHEGQQRAFARLIRPDDNRQPGIQRREILLREAAEAVNVDALNVHQVTAPPPKRPISGLPPCAALPAGQRR
ncbi:MAG: hypothetical protein NTZ05_06110 [Chloroflexi bacterium]|nr:hypothetical protein [Chloroflexota bacterium]